VKKRDDLNDVIREERSRGKKQPISTDAIKSQEERRKCSAENISARDAGGFAGTSEGLGLFERGNRGGA
jgi:hypothetical protein